jgi:predicted DNA-binding ribbon-helix-helix protein
MQVMLSLEPTFFEIIEILAEKEKVKIPAFIRKLVIEEIQRRNLLSESHLLRIIK